jgi:hypothetical protein
VSGTPSSISSAPLTPVLLARQRSPRQSTLDALALQVANGRLCFGQTSTELGHHRQGEVRLLAHQGSESFGRQTQHHRVPPRAGAGRVGGTAPAAGATEDFARVDLTQDHLTPLVGFADHLDTTRSQHVQACGLVTLQKNEATATDGLHTKLLGYRPHEIGRQTRMAKYAEGHAGQCQRCAKGGDQRVAGVQRSIGGAQRCLIEHEVGHQRQNGADADAGRSCYRAHTAMPTTTKAAAAADEIGPS